MTKKKLPKYEYKLVQSTPIYESRQRPDLKDLSDEEFEKWQFDTHLKGLNIAGENGWQLVGFHFWCYVLMREKP